MPMHHPSGRDALRRRGRKAFCAFLPARAGLGLLLAAGLLTACGDSAADTADHDPRPISTEEANRLAVSRYGLYREAAVAMDCDVLSERAPVRVTGWVDTVEHRAYGLVTGNEVGSFLAYWTQDVVNAQDARVTVPPLPVPTQGWESLPLDPEVSTLAAAQVLLVGLASDRPENPQLLMQSGATWLRTGEVDGTTVDVMTGPVPEGQTESSYRYWVDADGGLRRVEARLDGQRWTRCDLAPAPGVDIAPQGSAAG